MGILNRHALAGFGILLAVPLSVAERNHPAAGGELAPSPQGTQQNSERPVTFEPISVRNVDQVGLLEEKTASVNRMELGPGPNELVVHRDEGIEIVNDHTLKSSDA
jgi:hypothetical protein